MAEYTCIVCPVSCRVKVEEKDGDLVITGNQCKRGEKHARNEHLGPKRMLTTTVVVEGGVLSRLPVISSEELPREKLKACLKELYNIKIKAPVACGEIITKNILETGVDIKASRSLLEK